MRTIIAFIFAMLISMGAVFASTDDTTTPLVYVVKVTGAISPATHDYITSKIKMAEDVKAAAVVLEMHTPGGLVSSMQDIIQKILSSSVPVVTYVSPAGSHAASAGTYILYASHIAAMAPGTNIGAATPVNLQGESGEEKKSPGQDNGTAMEHKMVNDAVAYIKSLAELRNRNIDWAEKAVRDAATLTASEALKSDVIDLIANDIPELLEKIDGKKVLLGDKKESHTIKTRGARVENIEPDWRNQILAFITDPNIALLLMTLGTYGIIYEFSSPGTFFPGTIGVICLLLGLYAMNVLPINAAGLALIMVGLAMMGAEAIVAAHGVLGIGGAIAFALGATILIDSNAPGFGVDPLTIIAVTSTSLLFSLVVLREMAGSRRKSKDLISTATASVQIWNGKTGEVTYEGETWQAFSDEALLLSPNEDVFVEKTEGIRLKIKPKTGEPL